MNFYYKAQIDILRLIGKINPDSSSKTNFISCYESSLGEWLVYKTYAYLIPRDLLFLDCSVFRKLSEPPVPERTASLTSVYPSGIIHKAGNVRFEEFSNGNTKVYFDESILRKFPGNIRIFITEGKQRAPAVITDGNCIIGIIGGIAPIAHPGLK